MPTRRHLLAAAALLPLVATHRSLADETPEAFVASIYAHVTAGDGRTGGSEITDPVTRGRWFTRDLIAVWKVAEDKADKDGDIGPVDFDLLTDSQDPEVRRVSITPREVKPASAMVRVGLFAAKKAKAGEKPYSVLEFVLLREGGAWRIDEVRKVSGDPWSLRTLIENR